MQTRRQRKPDDTVQTRQQLRKQTLYLTFHRQQGCRFSARERERRLKERYLAHLKWRKILNVSYCLKSFMTGTTVTILRTFNVFSLNHLRK